MPRLFAIVALLLLAPTLSASDTFVLTDGGRVLCVVGLGDHVAAAQRAAYEGVARIDWRDHYFRRDIGHRAINRP